MRAHRSEPRVQPINVRASTIAAEVCMTIMRDSTAGAELRSAAAHVGLFLTQGPHDVVSRISADTVCRIQLQSEVHCGS